MDDSYFRSQCKVCDLVVYEGPWLSPPQRLSVQEHHRDVCGEGIAQRQIRPRVISTVASRIRTTLRVVPSAPSPETGNSGP